MGTRHESSRISIPPAVGAPGADDLATVADAQASSLISLGDVMAPMKQVWPAAGVAGNPLTADSGITATAPSFTGKTRYDWNSGAFNTQSQNWVVVPTGTGQNTSGLSMCANLSTARTWTYGPMSGVFGMSSMLDFSFVTDSATVTLIYQNFNAYSGNNYTDMQWYVERDGTMQKTSLLPTAYSAGAGVLYRRLTFADQREREHRIIAGGGEAWLCGVSIDSLATMRPAPNKFLFAYNGDSWGEPTGNALASPIHGAYPTGTYRTGGLVNALIEATGWACIQLAESGTGEFNANDSASRAMNYTGPGNTSVFHGHTRLDDYWTKFGSKSALPWTVGGWNDGTLPGVPYGTNYQTRVTAGIDYWIGKDPDIKLMYSSIQPVNLTASYNEEIAGQAAACAARPGNVIGFIDLTSMWADTSTSGQRGNNCNTTDTIHLTIKGADQVAGWMAASAKEFQIPTSYYQAMLTA